jgi:NADP-dependent 3-hydroxy acid dehydrogenase YdfG
VIYRCRFWHWSSDGNPLVSRWSLELGGMKCDTYAARSAYEGASLLLHYVKEEQKDMDNLAEYLKANSPSTKFETAAADLSNKEECYALAEKAKSVFNGKVDILFNNAGTQNEVESILDLSDEQWEYVFKTNIHAIFYLTKALIPMMPWGSSIINNASINPFVGHPKLVDYTSSKGAITAFTRACEYPVVIAQAVGMKLTNSGFFEQCRTRSSRRRVSVSTPSAPVLSSLLWYVQSHLVTTRATTRADFPQVLATMGKESLESFGVTSKRLSLPRDSDTDRSQPPSVDPGSRSNAPPVSSSSRATTRPMSPLR